MNYYYITTPIYFVNDAPHIGHTYTNLACDMVARFMRLDNKKVKFLTGTDEHGQKVEKAALKNQVTPQTFTNTVSQRFRELTKIANISNDDFIRTTEPRHINAAKHLWQQLESSENIYLGKYSGWYSIRDETFFDETELTKDGLAPTGASVEWVEEPSYFFALSKWQDKLLAFYERTPDFVKPKYRYNEVISFVKSGLKDLSISRTSFKWGIPVPNNKDHIIYVWLDALTNYISALGYPDVNNDTYKNFWPANVHVVAKDILRFHAVFWPAFLMAAKMPAPRCVMAHGWWTRDGQKMSKSLGNVISPIELFNEFGVDQVRYFLFREVTFGQDANFVRANLISRINTELANKLGNLVQRTLTFINKNTNGEIPNVDDSFITTAYNTNELILSASRTLDNTRLSMTNFELTKALKCIMDLVESANIYIDHTAPWHLKKVDPAKMMQVLYVLVETIRYIGILLQPFIPTSASKILDLLNIDITQRNFDCLNIKYALKPLTKLPTPKVIFPKYTKDIVSS